MPKNAVTDWDVNPANNTDVGGVNIAEFCPPSSVNDAERTIMAQIAAWIISAAGPLLKSGGTLSGPIAAAGFAITDASNASTIRDGAGTQRTVGYRSLPTSRSVAAAAIIALTDEGQVIKSTTGGLTVPNNSTVPAPVDFATSFYNNSNSAQTVSAAGGVTLRLEGSTSTVTAVSIPARTRGFFWQVAANEWIVSGKNVA